MTTMTVTVSFYYHCDGQVSSPSADFHGGLSLAQYPLECAQTHCDFYHNQMLNQTRQCQHVTPRWL